LTNAIESLVAETADADTFEAISLPKLLDERLER
jgi:hypothetical protein